MIICRPPPQPKKAKCDPPSMIMYQITQADVLLFFTEPHYLLLEIRRSLLGFLLEFLNTLRSRPPICSGRPPEPVTPAPPEIRACFPSVLCIWKMKASQGCPEIARVESRLACDGLGRDVASTADQTARVEPHGQINETRPISVTTALAPGDNYPTNNTPTRPFRAANFLHADRISSVCFNAVGQQA